MTLVGGTGAVKWAGKAAYPGGMGYPLTGIKRWWVWDTAMGVQAVMGAIWPGAGIAWAG